LTDRLFLQVFPIPAQLCMPTTAKWHPPVPTHTNTTHPWIRAVQTEFEPKRLGFGFADRYAHPPVPSSPTTHPLNDHVNPSLHTLHTPRHICAAQPKSNPRGLIFGSASQQAPPCSFSHSQLPSRSITTSPSPYMHPPYIPLTISQIPSIRCSVIGFAGQNPRRHGICFWVSKSLHSLDHSILLDSHLLSYLWHPIYTPHCPMCRVPVYIFELIITIIFSLRTRPTPTDCTATSQRSAKNPYPDAGTTSVSASREGQRVLEVLCREPNNRTRIKTWPEEDELKYRSTTHGEVMT
jgi:hypothetical protein